MSASSISPIRTLTELNNCIHFSDPKLTENSLNSMIREGVKALKLIKGLQQLTQSNICGLKVKRNNKEIPYSLLVGCDKKGIDKIFAIAHGRQIGFGRTKIAKLAFDLTSHQMCCVTKLTSTNPNDWDDLEFEARKEVVASEHLENLNGIAQLHLVVKTECTNKKNNKVKRIYLVQELGSLGTLDFFLRQYPEITLPLPIEVKWRLAFSFLEAVQQMHEKGMIHRDLKINNLVLGDDLTVKIIDFGLSRPVSSPHIVGEANWWDGEFAPPEVLRAATSRSDILLEKAMTPKLDCYCAGVILYQIFYGVSPYSWENNLSNRIKHIIVAEPNAWFPKHLTESSGANCPNRLIRELLDNDPDKRLSASAAVAVAAQINPNTQSAAPSLPIPPNCVNNGKI